MSVKTRRICCIAITVLTFLFGGGFYLFLLNKSRPTGA